MKPGFTLEQHRAIGQELHITRELLMSVLVSISKAYPLPVAAGISKAIDNIDRARSKLDDCVFKEQRNHIIETKELMSVYYPGTNT